MADPIAVGDEAPNFDLASTEDVVLMLRDEVPRSPVLVFFFPKPEDAAPELSELAGFSKDLAKGRVKLLGVSESSLDDLAAVQRQLSLPFPLLHDDRGFSRRYGTGDEAKCLLVLVDRDRRIAWLERDPQDLTSAMKAALAVADKMSSSTSNYPRSVINRLVDRWVN